MEDQRAMQNIASVMALLFNSANGVMAWVPVFYAGILSIVICVPFLRWVADEMPVEMYSSKHKKVDIKARLEEKFQNDDIVDVDFKSIEFRKAMFQTPFMVSSRKDENASMFSVIKAAPWRSYVQSIVQSDVGIGRFDLTAQQKKEVTMLFGQAMSLKPGQTEYTAFRYNLRQRNKKNMPAFGVPMWKELFSPAIREYFGMASNEEVHVDGTQARIQGNVLTFAVTKELQVSLPSV